MRSTRELRPGSSAARDQLAYAERRTIRTLLHCFFREVVLPTLASENAPPAAVWRDTGEWEVTLRSGGTLRVAVSHFAPWGTAEIEKAPAYVGCDGVPRPLGWRALFELLVEELSMRFGAKAHPDLRAQVEDSHRVLAALPYLDTPIPPAPLAAYVHSEQSLPGGHGFHPSPKNRIGFDENDLYSYSPEYGARFRLHAFEVPRDWVVADALDGADPIARLEEDWGVRGEDGRVALPVHPWQAKRLRQSSAIQDAIARGVVRDRGAVGPAFTPTASVRTLFREESAFFYKMSLDVRITNCFRRNTLSEMRAALYLARQFGPNRLLGPGFRLLPEVAYVGVHVPNVPDADATLVEHSFATLLRENLPWERDVIPFLAAFLFRREDGVRPLARWQAGLAGLGSWTETDRLRWFDAYVRRLLPPLCRMFFEEGFFSEPHLQNVVVGLENGWPTRLYLRDLDNCKVVDGGPAARRLAGLDAATRDELLLPRDVAWPRFVYCLFVNHLLEAAAALADDDTLREVALWSVVRMVLDEETSRVPADWRAEWDALREGAPLPAKGNLITRFRKGRDREAPFLRIPSPLRFCRGERR